MIRLRIVVRTKSPWETMTVESFTAQRDPMTPTEFVRLGKGVVPLWEEATGLAYFQYRARIRELCESKLRETGIPVTIGVGNIDWDSEDEALIPVDDDDIIYPSAVTLAERFTPDINLVVWNRITDYLGHTRLENPAYGGQLDTCNWAVRKTFLRDFHISQREFLLARHWVAAGIMAPKLGHTVDRSLLGQAKRCLDLGTSKPLNHPSILFLDEKHSVYFLHSGSISFLTHKTHQVKDLVPYLRGLPLHPLYEASCTP
jgi:hypothetical protein